MSAMLISSLRSGPLATWPGAGLPHPLSFMQSAEFSSKWLYGNGRFVTAVAPYGQAAADAGKAPDAGLPAT